MSAREREDGVKIEIACVVGARPNFMKMAPVFEALRGYPRLRPTLIHTGQHYDEAMSRVFFDELRMPTPDVNLEVGSATHAVQPRPSRRFYEYLEVAPRPFRVARTQLHVACAPAAGQRTFSWGTGSGLRPRRTMPES